MATLTQNLGRVVLALEAAGIGGAEISAVADDIFGERHPDSGQRTKDAPKSDDNGGDDPAQD